MRGDKSKSQEDRYGKSLANAWYHNPICKAMYFCDELATAAESAGVRETLTLAVGEVQT